MKKIFLIFVFLLSAVSFFVYADQGIAEDPAPADENVAPTPRPAPVPRKSQRETAGVEGDAALQAQRGGLINMDASYLKTRMDELERRMSDLERDIRSVDDRVRSQDRSISDIKRRL